MTTEVLFYILSGLLIVTGLVGVFLPVFPGVPTIFVGVIVAAIAAKFSFISTSTIVVLGLLTLVSVVIDFFSGFLGAKYSGAGILGSLGAVLGAIIGVSLLGTVGIVLGPALGVLVFEILAKRSFKKPAKSATYTLISTVLGMIINASIALTMIVVFVLSIFI